MNLSIRRKLYIVISGLILFFVSMSILLNNTLLERYYIFKKENVLKEVYTTINSLYNTGGEVELEIEKMERLRGIHVIIADKNYSVVLDTMTLKGQSSKGPKNFNPDNPENFETTIKERLPEIQSKKFILEDRMDRRLKTTFISLFGLMDNGNFVLLTIPVAAIHESVIVANKFFLLTGILTLIIGAILLYFITRKLTNPIVELNIIAQRMCSLDFNSRYNGKSKDEIGELGMSINTLSQKLKTTISELVEANNKLISDIENERRIDNMRKEFISNVSHELKTPIALIQGYSEGLMLNINEDEENKNFYCEVIIDEAGKMNRLVKELLELSIIESGQAKLDKTIFELSSLVALVVKKNMLLINEKEVNTEVIIPEIIQINADYDKIERVLVNFLVNAINHVNQEGIIKILAKSIDNKAKIIVYNSGKHIPQDSLDKIWTSFYKVDKARTREYGGTGLGLSIVRAILELHGFDYGVNNVEGGVEFWFEVNIY